MRIAQARSIVRKLRRAGILSQIAQNKAECQRLSPGRHPWAGNYVVEKHLPGGGIQIIARPSAA